MSEYKNQLKNYLSQQEINASRILSIGNQEDDKKYFKSVKCEEWLTLDYEAKMRPNLFWDMNNEMFDLDGNFGLNPDYIEYFDVILALNLWEYIWNPIAAHDNIKHFLKPGGILWTNYPFVYPAHEPKGTDYLRYNRDGVIRLLNKAGLTLVEEQPIFGNKLLVDFYQVDGMKARAGSDHSIVGFIIKAKK